MADFASSFLKPLVDDKLINLNFAIEQTNIEFMILALLRYPIR